MGESTFHIGFSGHQQLGGKDTIEFVSRQLRELLVTYREHASQQEKDVVVYSALALGADQLFITIALDLGIPVETIIPCSNYEKNYTSSEDQAEFQRLLNASNYVYRLP